MIRKTKIICTIGPACADPEKIKQMIKAGMNIARFNFSHGDYDYHKKNITMVREASEELGIPVGILLDTKGPEIRTGKTKTGKIVLEEGKEITLVMEQMDEGTEDRLSLSYTNLVNEVKPGIHILIADGVVDLEVIETIGDKEIRCKVINGGEFGDKKNVNVPGIKVGLPAITEKDESDILFGIENDVDFIAASFIRKPEDVREIKKILKKHNSDIHIISKIESEEGVDNIDEIINVSEGVMVARGDLGVQMKAYEIPIIQKMIINKCNKLKKPVVTATQMLDSMIHNPRPTRAETTDVANAIIDGTDAVMLSGETAGGKYPIKSVEMMSMIAETTENSNEYAKAMEQKFKDLESKDTIEDSVCHSARHTAHNISANAILTPTLSGNTARLLSHFRPKMPILAVTTKKKTQSQLLIVSGVFPLITGLVDNTDQMLSECIKQGLSANYIHNSDKVVIVAGVPMHSRNTVNLIKIHLVSNTLAKGKGFMGKFASGHIVKAKSPEEAFSKLTGERGEILLIPSLSPKMTNLLMSVRGVIIQEACSMDAESLKAKNPNLVIVSEVTDAMQILEEGFRVTVDGNEGLIYEGNIEKK